MKKNTKTIIESLKINKNDVGSSQVQIGLLSEKINYLSKHFALPSQQDQLPSYL